MDRRKFLKFGIAGAASIGLANFIGGQFLKICPVKILGASDYDKDISKDIEKAFIEDGLILKGKKVLLKPNFVELHEGRPINTNPKLLRNIVEACFRQGAAKITIGEAAGHRRDSYFSVLHPSMIEAMPANVELIDLNFSDFSKVKNNGYFTDFEEFFIPNPILDADIVINVPKMKTHHWVGVTLSLKNLFGTLPGTCYGWPKNILHIKGIRKSILDLSMTVPIHYSIIDGIVGMEGDGPIMGTPKGVGAVIMSRFPLAADVTAAEIMGFDPNRVEYLAGASMVHHGFTRKGREFQWEKPEKFATKFQTLKKFDYMKL
jgi:uncharacterized protein (DUF362 family)